MISNQILQSTIDGLKNITRKELSVVEKEGKVIATTEENMIGRQIDAVENFITSPAESQLILGYQYFKIYDNGVPEYVIQVKGEDEASYQIGKVAAFQIQSLLVAYKERFDKEKAQRDADADKYLQYALTIGKMKDADKQRGLQAWQTEQTLARQDRAFDAGRQDRADDVAFRNKDYDERVRQWQANFDRQGEWHEEEGQRWERQFKESVRQFNVSAANERARINMESQRLAHSLKEGQMTFNLGSGNGNVTLTLDKLNAQTVSRIYHTLSPEVRDKVQGDPIVRNGFVVGYKPPTTEAMLIAIGANVESSPATQNAIKQVAGLEVGDKPAGY